MKERYNGRLFSVLGDSISTLAGYSKPADMAYYTWEIKQRADISAPEETWWGEVIDALGAELLVNNSIYGSTTVRMRGCEYPSYGFAAERIEALSDGKRTPDVVMVYMGTNDWGGGVKPVPESDSDALDTSVFSVAYACILDGIREAYPGAEIWCLTLPITACGSNPAFDFPYRYRGRHIEEYCDVIRAAADERGCLVIDLYRSGKRPDTLDGFHPNRAGMRTIAETVLESLAKNRGIG